VTALRGKAVLVTGAASGLGQASAKAAVAAGARVYLSDIDELRLREAWDAESRAGLVYLHPADVSEPAAGGELVAGIVNRFARLDGLVNAAGIFDTRRFLDIEPEHFDRIFDVHVRGAFFIAQAAARVMSTQDSGGSIVNFSSSAGRHPRPLAPHYAAAKAAVISFTRSAAVALAPDGVRVNCVCPGLIETPMIDAIRRQRAELLGRAEEEIDADWKQLVPMGRLGTPEEVAAVVMFLLSEASSYVTGEAIGITGGTDGS
jgi:D-sorbitol dehydrogenase (acceptor)